MSDEEYRAERCGDFAWSIIIISSSSSRSSSGSIISIAVESRKIAPQKYFGTGLTRT